MGLDIKHFEKITNGEKNIESRLYDKNAKKWTLAAKLNETFQLKDNFWFYKINF